VVLVPEEAGSLGIADVSGRVEAQIIALRDHPEPGRFANFWGTLNRDVPDYRGCQLLVSRLRAGTEISGPEPIEGWVGKIYSYRGGMQFDDYFVLEGKYPVQFGIASSIDGGGLPNYAEALEGLRDTGQTVLVSGRLMCGVPDTNGCQILVNRLQVEGVEIVVSSK
jgi:hypothetical protein